MKKLTTKPKITEKVVEKVIEEITELIEAEGGYIDDIGENVVVICTSLIYYGKLTGVNNTVIQIEDPYAVYETGNWEHTKWKDAQRMPMKRLTINCAQIESLGRATK